MQGCYIIHKGVYCTALLQLMTISYGTFDSYMYISTNFIQLVTLRNNLLYILHLYDKQSTFAISRGSLHYSSFVQLWYTLYSTIIRLQYTPHLHEIYDVKRRLQCYINCSAMFYTVLLRILKKYYNILHIHAPLQRFTQQYYKYQKKITICYISPSTVFYT